MEILNVIQTFLLELKHVDSFSLAGFYGVYCHNVEVRDYDK